MRISSIFNLVFVCGVSLFFAGQASAQVIVFQETFDVGTTNCFTFLDRNGETEIANASYSVVDDETGNGVLEQSVDNFDFPRGPINNAPTLGTIALSGSGVIGGAYSISVDFDSLEETNTFQDHALVFAYEDADNFFYIEATAFSPARFDLNQVVAGERSTISTQGITFSQGVTPSLLSVDTLTGTVSFNYNDLGDVELATGLTIAAGLNGVGSNNDAFTIDNFIVTDTTVTNVLLGDVNLSGEVDFLDISPFIGVLSSGGTQAEADINESGVVDFLDIAPFIAILSGG